MADESNRTCLLDFRFTLKENGDFLYENSNSEEAAGTEWEESGVGNSSLDT